MLILIKNPFLCSSAFKLFLRWSKLEAFFSEFILLPLSECEVFNFVVSACFCGLPLTDLRFLVDLMMWDGIVTLGFSDDFSRDLGCLSFCKVRLEMYLRDGFLWFGFCDFSGLVGFDRVSACGLFLCYLMFLGLWCLFGRFWFFRD